MLALITAGPIARRKSEAMVRAHLEYRAEVGAAAGLLWRVDHETN